MTMHCQVVRYRCICVSGSGRSICTTTPTQNLYNIPFVQYTWKYLMNIYKCMFFFFLLTFGVQDHVRQVQTYIYDNFFKKVMYNFIDFSISCMRVASDQSLSTAGRDLQYMYQLAFWYRYCSMCNRNTPLIIAFVYTGQNPGHLSTRCIGIGAYTCSLVNYWSMN